MAGGASQTRSGPPLGPLAPPPVALDAALPALLSYALLCLEDVNL